MAGKELKRLGLGGELLAWIADLEHYRGAVIAHSRGHIVECDARKGRIER